MGSGAGRADARVPLKPLRRGLHPGPPSLLAPSSRQKYKRGPRASITGSFPTTRARPRGGGRGGLTGARAAPQAPDPAITSPPRGSPPRLLGMPGRRPRARAGAGLLLAGAASLALAVGAAAGDGDAPAGGFFKHLWDPFRRRGGGAPGDGTGERARAAPQRFGAPQVVSTRGTLTGGESFQRNLRREGRRTDGETNNAKGRLPPHGPAPQPGRSQGRHHGADSAYGRHEPHDLRGRGRVHGRIPVLPAAVPGGGRREQRRGDPWRRQRLPRGRLQDLRRPRAAAVTPGRGLLEEEEEVLAFPVYIYILN